jgi:alkylation response protein AidB-like acyl-CoA dehydrogenase
MPEGRTPGCRLRYSFAAAFVATLAVMPAAAQTNGKSRPICEFQGLQWMLVDMSTRIEAARTLIHRAAANAGDDFSDVTEAAQAKIFASEMAIDVTNDALQMFGAAGYSRARPLGAHGSRRAHVHHRWRHGADPAHRGRLAPSRPQAAPDARRLRVIPASL